MVFKGDIPFFAIVLFIYADSSKVGSTRDVSQQSKIIQLTSTKSATVSVPLSLTLIVISFL